MAETTNSIFNKKATEKLRNPDDLDKFVRVTNPSVWVALAACLALLAGLFAWGVFGAVTTSVSCTGTSINGKTMCFVTAEDIAKINIGDDAIVGGEHMKVSAVGSVPLSRGEASKLLVNDYLVDTLMKSDWAYQVSFDGDSSELTQGVPLTTSITVERIAPISLIFGRNE